MAEEQSAKLEVKAIARNVSVSVGRRMAEELGFHKPGRVIGKIEGIRSDIGGLNVNCRCVMGATGTPSHSGRYPWKETVPLNLPPGVPSPGFVFADKNWIKRNMMYTVDWKTDTLKCIVRNGELTIRKEFSYQELLYTNPISEWIDEFEDYIISKLAREYDNIMIRKVLNMDNTRFNRFISLLDAAGGNFKMEHSVDVNPMVKIEIPYNMLHHLHIDGDGSALFNPDGPFSHSSGRIPGIRQIQTFNDRVVQITFIDGSQTKCVCGKDEFFDLYEGIAFCLFKRFLGKEKGHKHFNDLMRYAFKKLDEQEKQKEREAEIEAEKKRHEEKKKLQAQRWKEKKREEKIGIFVEALKRNLQDTIGSMPVYSVPETDVEFNKEPKEEQE